MASPTGKSDDAFLASSRYRSSRSFFVSTRVDYPLIHRGWHLEDFLRVGRLSQLIPVCVLVDSQSCTRECNHRQQFSAIWQNAPENGGLVELTDWIRSTLVSSSAPRVGRTAPPILTVPLCAEPTGSWQTLNSRRARVESLACKEWWPRYLASAVAMQPRPSSITHRFARTSSAFPPKLILQ